MEQYIILSSSFLSTVYQVYVNTHMKTTVKWKIKQSFVIFYQTCPYSLCISPSPVQNSTHYLAQVTLFNNMSSHPWPDGSVSMPSARLQVPIQCSFMGSVVNSIVISMGTQKVLFFLWLSSPCMAEVMVLFS